MKDDDSGKKEAFRKKLDEDWIDVPQFIKGMVHSFDEKQNPKDNIEVPKRHALAQNDK
jgi:hypothetical protein